MQDPLDISHGISCALNRNEAVVALESSVIAQGLPPDVSVRTALEMEDEVRASGAVPATVGVIEGKIRVGLTGEEIERLARGQTAKLAVRDVPYAVARNLDGGTTVSATARTASAAGISVMATGGVGGVHRGWARTGDVSADLWELARTPIIVVCSGVKAVLDVAATAEWLESHSVPIYGYQTAELPAFYARSSGISIPQLDSAEAVAELARLCGGVLGMRCAMVVAVPPPAEQTLDVSSHIEQAVSEAAEQGIIGKALTPWLLSRVGELTGGKSVEANIALLKNNARVAAEIAAALLEDSQRRMGFVV